MVIFTINSSGNTNEDIKYLDKTNFIIKKLILKKTNFLNELFIDLIKQIKNNINSNIEFSIIGNCLGGLLAFELYYKLLEIGLKPTHLFIINCNVPYIRPLGKNILENFLNLSDKNMISFLNKFNGNFLYKESDVLCLRKDLNIIKLYKFKEKFNLIECNVTIIFSSNDILIDNNTIFNWKDFCSKNVNFYDLEIGHSIDERLSNIIFDKLMI